MVMCFLCIVEAQQYVKIFSDIERYSQLRSYYIGCHKVSVLAWLAQSVEHETLNLRVVGSSPTLGDCFFCFFFSFHIYSSCFLFFICSFVLLFFLHLDQKLSSLCGTQGGTGLVNV